MGQLERQLQEARKKSGRQAEALQQLAAQVAVPETPPRPPPASAHTTPELRQWRSTVQQSTSSLADALQQLQAGPTDPEARGPQQPPVPPRPFRRIRPPALAPPPEGPLFGGATPSTAFAIAPSKPSARHTGSPSDPVNVDDRRACPEGGPGGRRRGSIGKRSQQCTHGRKNISAQTDEPRNIRRKTVNPVRHLVEVSYEIPKLLPRDQRPTKNSLGRNAAHRNSESLGPTPIRHAGGK